jgi:protein-tyrosine-phosphatase
MPVSQSIWKVDEKPIKLSSCSLKNENELEEMICQDISILSEKWLPIGRQVSTEHGGIIDILAVDESGNLVVVELKKNKTPREVVTQAIDYASWIKTLDSAKIADIYKKYGKGINDAYDSLDEALKNKFNKSFGEDDINNAHQIVVVASELDLSTERIIKYLNDYEIPINTVFFNLFRDGETRYLSRAWLIDPAETQEHANLAKAGDTEPWNGEYYVSFGHNMGRHWEDARKYGFIGAGGGRWYSKTLSQLSKGDRVWVNIPQTGYVGVGIVEEPAVMAKDFMVKTEKGEVPITEAPLKLDEQTRKDYLMKYAEDEEKAEYFVKVKWLRNFPIKQAVSELGFFGNQNSVCKPRSSKWLFTVDTLKKKWGIS